MLLLLWLFCLPALAADSGYFGCDFVDNKITNTYYFAPATVAGIRAGDVITQIDGIKVTAANSRTTLAKLKGLAGTTVDVSVLRRGKTLSFTVKRDSLPRPVFVKHETGEEYYIDGMRQLDCGYIPTARLALEEAESMGDKLATMSLKTLLPKEDPTKAEMEEVRLIKNAIKDRQLIKAYKLCTKALLTYPKSESLTLLSAYITRLSGHYKQALIICQKLKQLNPNYQPGLIELAYNQALSGNLPLAEETFYQTTLLNSTGDEIITLDNFLKGQKRLHHR